METYPIMIDEELAGKLTVDRQGARTIFDAECRMRPDLVRISVYGGGKEGYLGVLAPEGDRLRLRKTLSRSEMRAFPEEIESAERAGLDRSPKPEAVFASEAGAGSPHGAAPEPDPDGGSEPEQDVGTAHGAAPDEESPAAEPEPAPEPEPREAPASDEAEGLDWYSSPDGALVCFDGTQTLIALPDGDGRVPADIPGERRTVEGREYLVYRTKDGRIV